MGEILFIAHRVPWPPNRGDKIRSYHFLRKLIEVAPVHVACFADSDTEAATNDSLKEQLASCEIVERNKPQWQAGVEALLSGKPVSLTSFENEALAASVKRTIQHNQIDCIFVFSGQMAQYVPTEFNGRFIMDFADVDSAKFESYAASGLGPMTWINRREARLLKGFEASIGQSANQSLFVSEQETTLFHQRSGLGPDKVRAIGNGVDLSFYDPSKVEAVEKPTSGPLVLFTGQMDYRPNIEAVRSFAIDAMPSIVEQYHNACFAVVGRSPTNEVTSLNGHNGVIVTGAVPDVRPWLKAADIVVAPLRIARGIQNKVLEAMAMGKPVVASTPAAEGIMAEHAKHFLVAKTHAEETQQIFQLLKDRPFAELLGEAAKQHVHKFYSWDNQLSDLHSICGFSAEPALEAAE